VSRNHLIPNERRLYPPLLKTKNQAWLGLGRLCYAVLRIGAPARRLAVCGKEDNMTNIILNFPVRRMVPLTCVWYATGDPARPLACRWIANNEAGSEAEAASAAGAGTRRMCA